METKPVVDIIIIPYHGRNNLATLTLACQEIEAKLVAGGVRAAGDYRDSHKHHWKFQGHIDAGVPFLLELGDRDIHANTAVITRFDTHQKQTVSLNTIVDDVKRVLELK